METQGGHSGILHLSILKLPGDVKLQNCVSIQVTVSVEQFTAWPGDK